MMLNLAIEIVEGFATEGGLLQEAMVAGRRVATGRASAEILSDMWRVLGMSRDQVAAEHREALTAYVKGHLADVSIAQLTEDPQRPLRFTGRYTARQFDEISTGTAWYDVGTSATGPEGVPPMVRNRLRHEVHHLLTSKFSAARELLDPSGEEPK
jgi:hypothetical protein